MKPLLLALSVLTLVHADDDPLAAWSQDVRIAPVPSIADRHSIHNYNGSEGPFSRLFVAEVRS